MCSMSTCCSWVLVGDDGRHVELHAVQIELAAAAGNFPLHSRSEIVDVELRDLLRILSSLDVDVPELHGHARFLLTGICPRCAECTCRGSLADEQRNSTDIVGFTAFLELARA